MSANRTEMILQVAKKLLKHLPEPLNTDLKTLLTRADKGENTTISIIKLLSVHENIRRWMNDEISALSGMQSEGGTRGYGSLAGKPTSVSTSQKWTCPASECHESFPDIQEDEDRPMCDVHGIVMVRPNK